MKATSEPQLINEVPSPWSRRWIACALAFGAVACTGTIGDSAPNRGTGTESGATSTSGAGSSTASTGGTGTAMPMPPPGGPTDVGRVAIHRLNNTEYDNTMRDLLGVTSTGAKTFIADEQLFGFDNIAEAFGMTDARFEQYYAAADALVDQTFADSGLRSRIMTCVPAGATDVACMQRIIGAFGLRAWRRPLETDEVTRLVKIATDAITLGEDATGGVKQAIKSILVSAKFLYRIELDQNPASIEPHPVGGYELASRLSYLGWSSMPDPQLFAAAESGAILSDATLSSELDRVLADSKAANFVSSFAGQWLGVRGLLSHQVEPTAFADWSEPLRQAMVQEGLLFFSEFLSGERKMTDFFTADVNFVDPTLGKLYGVNVSGTGVQKISNTSDQRVGFLGLAGFLTATSFSYRTAPTLRGVWVLEHLLCEEIPAPPPDVPELDKDNGMSAASQSQNVRVRLEAHRANPSCASCHTILDPIGLGLENFDAIGRFRTTYTNGDMIDSSGVMPGGGTFKNLPELANILSKDTRLIDCASKNLMTYALSRGLADTDQPYLKQVRDRWQAEGLGLKSLMKQIVLNDTFRFRRGEIM